jgi:acetyl-CoA carboxylase biotin carboxyl carrier protein
VGLTDDDIREILRIIDESDLDELSIETAGFSLHVSKGVGDTGGAGARSETAREAPAISERAPVPTATPPPSAAAPQNGHVVVPSPMLGTFYRAESPGAEPFVKIGTEVEPDTTVCIIEVMKMMNSVPAGVRGVITEVCSENGRLVEYGEPLFHVDPS